MKRTIKVDEEAYQRLSHRSEKENRTIGDIASTILLRALSGEQKRGSGGEVWINGKRIK